MQFLGTVILPKEFKYFKSSIEDNQLKIEAYLETFLEQYKKNNQKIYEQECLCKENKAKAETFNLLKVQFDTLYQKWNEIKYKDKQKSNILRLDPDLTSAIKNYYEMQLERIPFTPDCEHCSGTGLATIPSRSKFSYLELGGVYSKFWKRNKKYPANIEKVKNITEASNVLVLPNQIWLEKPENSIIDFSFQDVSNNEWREFFMKSIHEYDSHFAALVTFSKNT